MITTAIPVIAITDSARSEDYYCRVLGFEKMFAYRPDPARSDPCYLGVARDGVELHLHSFKPERAGMTDAFLWVTDVDAVHAEVAARGANVQLPPTDQTWGTRETGIRDPDGNALVFAIKQPAAPPPKREAARAAYKKALELGVERDRQLEKLLDGLP